MTQPVLDPPDELFRAPLRDEVFDDGVLTATEEQQAQRIQQQAEEGNNLEVVALALGASFLLYRRYMRRRLMEQAQPNWTADALLTAAAVAWVTFVPRWLRLVAPIIAVAYWHGTREARRGDLSPELVDRAANEYARSMGDYVHQISSHALLEGFNAYLNRKATRKVAAEKAINAFGLTARPMRSVVAAEKLTEQAVSTVEARELDTKMERHIRHLLLGRAKTIGDNEAFAAAKQAKQLVWMWQSGHGKLPKEAYKEWVTARDERVCEYCGPMHGETAPVNEPFKTDLGEVWMPSLHPSCRCDVTLRVPTKSLFGKSSDFEREHPRGAKGRFREKPDAVELNPENQRLLREAFLRAIPVAETEEKPRLERGHLAAEGRLTGEGRLKARAELSGKGRLTSRPSELKSDSLQRGGLKSRSELEQTKQLQSKVLSDLTQTMRRIGADLVRLPPAEHDLDELDHRVYLVGQVESDVAEDALLPGGTPPLTGVTESTETADDQGAVKSWVKNHWRGRITETIGDLMRNQMNAEIVDENDEVKTIEPDYQTVEAAFRAMTNRELRHREIHVVPLEHIDRGDEDEYIAVNAADLQAAWDINLAEHLPVVYRVKRIHNDDDYFPSEGKKQGTFVSGGRSYEVVGWNVEYVDNWPYREVVVEPVVEDGDFPVPG